MHTRYALACSVVALCLMSGDFASADSKPFRTSPTDRLTVHEWGTFTCLQDEAGRAIPGINSDDEPVPDFVHQISNGLIVGPSQLAPVFYKAVPRAHRFVNMRLETPVIYFYPPAGKQTPTPIDLSVHFRGGWLTEYYPQAAVDAPGLQDRQFRYGPITSETVGSLNWSGFQLGGAPTIPETEERVWLAPRDVAAAPVRLMDGSGEKFLFYRGVGHVDAPLKVIRNSKTNMLLVSERFDPKLFSDGESRSTTLWLLDVQPNGETAWRSIEDVSLNGKIGRTIAELPAEFAPKDYSKTNLKSLRREMHRALVADGLFADEADALLNTWESGYFKSAGLRLFFLLPQQWTDDVLPMRVSEPADITRTMVGRIELVTPKHRQLIEQIEKGPVSDLRWLYESRQGVAVDAQTRQQLWEGEIELASTRIQVPPDYLSYVALGRFRIALILDALQKESTENLKQFAKIYGLMYFDPEE